MNLKTFFAELPRPIRNAYIDIYLNWEPKFTNFNMKRDCGAKMYAENECGKELYYSPTLFTITLYHSHIPYILAYKPRFFGQFFN